MRSTIAKWWDFVRAAAVHSTKMMGVDIIKTATGFVGARIVPRETVVGMIPEAV